MTYCQQIIEKIIQIAITKELGDVLEVLFLYGRCKAQYLYFVERALNNMFSDEEEIDDHDTKLKTAMQNAKRDYDIWIKAVRMITTDRVVFLLCVALKIPCIDSGRREGLTSGTTNVDSFIPVEMTNLDIYNDYYGLLSLEINAPISEDNPNI